MSKQLTIEEAKQLKQECEKRIAEFVQGFEERTGYVVHEIELERRTVVGFTTSSTQFSRTDVKLITEVK
ncbi:hypothetical protein [Muribaculum intestinale]|uniref:hypothetical protein n=1 Tax=Muribaculum intestinale TaxID=1796646 RepID=UPI00242B962D|nr:hypothetical protein [Muribaculum intestinale]